MAHSVEGVGVEAVLMACGDSEFERNITIARSVTVHGDGVGVVGAGAVESEREERKKEIVTEKERKGEREG